MIRNVFKVSPIWLVLLALVFGTYSPDDATAQGVGLSQSTPPATTQVAPPSPNDIKELLRLLSDEKVVNWLKEDAQKVLDGGGGSNQENNEALRARFVEALERTRKRALLLQSVWHGISEAPSLITKRWQDEISGFDAVRSLTYIVIFLFVGAGLEWLFRQYTSNLLLRLELLKPSSLIQRLGAASSRALIILGGLAIFATGSIGGFLSFEWPTAIAVIVLNILLAILSIRAVSTVSMFFLAPRVAELRLAPFDNVSAKQFHFHICLGVAVVTFAITVSDTIERFAGAEAIVGDFAAATFSVSIIAGLVVLLFGLWVIWWISKPSEMAERNRRTVFWRNYLSIILLSAFELWLIDAVSLMWTVFIVGLLPPVLILIYGWIDHFFDDAEGLDRPTHLAEETALVETEATEAPGDDVPDEVTEEPDHRGRYDNYRPIAHRLMRFVIIVGAVITLLAAWGTDVFTLSDSPTLAGRIASIAIDMVVAILIADLIWVWAKTAIDRRLADYKPPEGPQAPGPEARMATLLPLLRMMLLVTLIVMLGLSFLSSMGVNIAPLLAGAGIIGVAIGFGAQALVRDIVSGIFFLIDDAFRVGEYIEIGNLRGVVEGMSVRSLRVRHHRGAVHTIPFGELTSLTNYSRDWVIMKLDFRVPFETDIKLVKKIVKRIGAEMLEDPLYADGFLQPLKSQGVRRMEEFNMVVGVKFMTKPGEQWIIRRDAYQKIVDAFEANGIRLAERNVKVEVITDRPLSEEEHQAVVGAAQDAIEQPVGPPVPVPDEP